MALGLYVIISGVRLGFGEWQDPGPGFIAVLSGCALFFLSALWLVMTMAKKWGLETTKKFFAESDSYKRVLLTLVSLVVFAAFLNRIGFMIATLALLIFLFRAIDPQKWRIAIPLALVITIVCVIVFQIWLQVQLPEGPISIYTIMRWLR
jgi:putative tricarboxylic transport membrane protein